MAIQRVEIQPSLAEGVMLEYAGENKYPIIQNVPNSDLVVKARKGATTVAYGADAAWLQANGWRVRVIPKPQVPPKQAPKLEVEKE